MSVTVSEQLPLLAAAPNGIRKLRELILELAVRGKLVAQDAGDEPASELLKRIAAEKKRLVAEGKIRQPKPLVEIGVPAEPFVLPKGWIFVRLGEFGLIGSSARVHQKDWKASGVPFYRAREIVRLSKYGSVENGLFISEELYGSLSSRGLTPAASDLMITGVGTIGVPYQVRSGDRFYYKDASVLVLKKYVKDKSDFLLKFLSSPMWVKSIHAESMGTTVHTLTIARASDIVFPLPPLAEQHRIVAKVDELMALCDRLEARQADAESAHAQLVATLLDNLTQARDSDDFAANWQRLSAHFHTLFTTESSIDALKQTLLQLAVMGKLVPQDSSDESAHAFLQQHEIKAGPHTLPGWATVALGHLGEILGGSTPSKANAEFCEGDIPWVSPKDMKRPLIDDAEDHITRKALESTSLKLIPPNSLLMVVRGMILVHSFPVALTTREVTINQDMKALMPPAEISIYLLVYLQAAKRAMVSLVDRSSHGTCKLISEKLWSHSVCVPPLAEQQRIVAKVDQLMALCDQLKSRLIQGRQLNEQLAGALVEHAVA